MGAKAKTALKIVAASMLVAIIIFCVGACISLAEDTLVSWWKPFLISGMAAAALSQVVWRFWRWILDTDTKWVCYSFAVVSVTLFLASSWYVLNYALGDRTAVSYSRLPIERVYREKHYQTRRVSRRTYARGAPYWVYKADVRLPEEKIVGFKLTAAQYKSLQKGDTLVIAVRKGALGVPVVDPSMTQFPTLKKKKPRDRYRDSTRAYRRYRMYRDSLSHTRAGGMP